MSLIDTIIWNAGDGNDNIDGGNNGTPHDDVDTLKVAADGHNLTLTANGGGAAAGAITTNGSALDVNGTLAMNAATGVGTLASPMVLSHAAGTTLTVISDTSLTIVSPVHAAGLVDVTVTNPAGTNVLGTEDRFTYFATPTVTSVAPTAPTPSTWRCSTG